MKEKRLGQRGVASIIITMITMVVISLIVIGFALISRREQRQSLDQQLSTQAYYAAESGVEDARNAIKARLASNPNQEIPAKTDCTTDPSGVYPTGDKMIIDDQYDVSYTCLTVDPSPKSVKFNGVGESNIVIPINTDNPITSLRLTWTPTSTPGEPSSGCPTNVDQTLRRVPNWNCGYGMLRVDATPTGAGLTRANMVSGTLTGFFEPTTGTNPGTLNYAASRVKPNLIAADCDTAGGAYGTCQATITNIGGGIRNFNLRLSSIYQSSNITIEALNGTTPQKIIGVQAMVDSTGKASDVLRRIQVRLPVVATGLLPTYAIQSTSSLCKRFATNATQFVITGVIDPDPGNPMCLPQSDGQIQPCVAYNDIAFVLDRSGSMNDPWETGSKLQRLKEITNQFIQSIEIGPDKNHGAIVTFAGEGRVDQDLTGDTAPLVAAVNSMGQGGNNSGTNYYAGMQGAQQVFAGPNARPGTKKIIIFMSDGDPTRDEDLIQPTADALAADGVIFYTIGIAKDIGDGKQILSDMTANGGRFGDAALESDLQAILNSIVLDIACKES